LSGSPCPRGGWRSSVVVRQGQCGASGRSLCERLPCQEFSDIAAGCSGGSDPVSFADVDRTLHPSGVSPVSKSSLVDPTPLAFRGSGQALPVAGRLRLRIHKCLPRQSVMKNHTLSWWSKFYEGFYNDRPDGRRTTDGSDLAPSKAAVRGAAPTGTRRRAGTSAPFCPRSEHRPLRLIGFGKECKAESCAKPKRRYRPLRPCLGNRSDGYAELHRSALNKGHPLLHMRCLSTGSAARQVQFLLCMGVVFDILCLSPPSTAAKAWLW
jgi:hypothetical protein